MWRDILKAEVDATNQATVARRLEYSPAVVSQVLSGTYRGATERVAARVLEVFGRVACPFLGREIGREQCTGHRERAVPTSGREAVRFWQACQQCTSWKPQGGKP